MPSRLRVELSDLEHGWITLEIRCGENQITYAVSYIYPSFTELIMVLQVFPEPIPVGIEREVRWCLEPGDLVMTFGRSAGGVHLRVDEIVNARRHARVVPEIDGDFATICLPFWRAMRRIVGTHPREYIEQHWRGFPFDTLPQARPGPASGKQRVQM